MSAITLRVELPNGQCEALSTGASKPGAAILAALQPLRSLHSVPPHACVLRPDGQELLAEAAISEQGISEGSILKLHVAVEQRRREEPVQLTQADIREALLEEEEEEDLRAEERKALEDAVRRVEEAKQHAASTSGEGSAQGEAAAGGDGSSSRPSTATASQQRTGDVPATPEALRWRKEQEKLGFALPFVSHVWSRMQSGSELDDDVVASLHHALRARPGLQAFFRESCLRYLGDPQWEKARCLLLGLGSGSALSVLADLLRHGHLPKPAALVEPSSLLLQSVAAMGENSFVLAHATGQMDSAFVIPTTALAGPCSADDGAGNRVLLLCDRLSEDLLGERLLPTVCAAHEAVRTQLPEHEVHCIPSNVTVLCAPMEIRNEDLLGCDITKMNALRFSASVPEDGVLPGAKAWRCGECGHQNVAQAKKLCDSCRAPRPKPSAIATGGGVRESNGWWPLDLDEEADGNEICKFCSEPLVLATFELGNYDVLQQQRRVMTRTLEFTTTSDCRINAMAVWWQLESRGPLEHERGPVCFSTAPFARPPSGCCQAIYYFGFELSLERDQLVKIRADTKDDACRFRFELEHPKLTDRMGLVKMQVPLTSTEVATQLAEHLDRHTNRLKVDIPSMQLQRRDKMIQFGPFELRPGTFTDDLWQKVEQRIKNHADRPRVGDKPVPCIFARGAFEGSLRWPPPDMQCTACVPRLPFYFHRSRLQLQGDTVKEVLSSSELLSAKGPLRLLEIGCGPVPLLAILAARNGARAWAVEMNEGLRELAVEAVRDNGLEMISPPKGMASYSFFGKAKKPDGPSVRVMPAMPSTSFRAGATGKFLDGRKAHVVACIPETQLLCEDYLVTMVHARDAFLEASGVLLPSSVQVKVLPVDWVPMVHSVDAAFFASVWAGRQVLLSKQDLLALKPLMTAPATLRTIDFLTLTSEDIPVFESAACRVETAGQLSGFACWLEVQFGKYGSGTAAGDNCTSVPVGAVVAFCRRQRDVSVGEVLHVAASLKEHKLCIVEAQAPLAAEGPSLHAQ